MDNKQRFFGASVLTSCYAIFKLIVHFRGEMSGCLQTSSTMFCMDFGYDVFRHVMDVDLIYTTIACTGAAALWWHYYAKYVRDVQAGE